MAITITAPRSSTIASATKKVRSDFGILFPSNAKAPKAKAISVAIGIPQPSRVCPVGLMLI